MNRIVPLLLIFLTISGYNIAFSQATISGKVSNTDGNPLSRAHVSLSSSGQFATTDTSGNFEIKNIESGNYILTVTHLGFKTYTEAITTSDETLFFSIILEEDPLHLQGVVVTGHFEPRLQLESSTTVTTLQSKTIQQTISRGTANLLQLIPGTFTDPSAGEVFTKVYSRGISASAEDDIGWYYISLQEDGLPVSLVQHSYYSPDLFHRVDLTTSKVEAIIGGNTAITALNGPGGIYNFISHGPSSRFGGELQLQGGVQGEGNPHTRIDGTFGGPLGNNNWFYNIGGHYRVDDGARNTDFTFSKGGQLKFNLTKTHANGYLKFLGKILDDFTNRYTGVAATDFNNPTAAFGQDFNSTALLLPAFSSDVPDGRRIEQGATNAFDPSQGVHAQDRAFGLNLFQNLGEDWSLQLNTRYSRKKAFWQTSISNAFVSLNNPLAYFISGADFPIGEVVFRDINTNNEIARLDNSGILSGESIAYTGDGTLPNDAILGIASWLKQTRAREWVNQTTLRKKTETHDFNLGLASGFSNTSLYTQGSFAYATYEPNPRALQVSLENPGQPALALSDENGLSNYGGLFFDNARAKVSQIAFFINDRWRLDENIHLDAGLRYETIRHNGSKDRFAPFQQVGGVDGDPLTAFDNGVLTPTGEQDEFDFNYNYLSYSAALNYKFAKEASVYARLSRGNKAPELNYYFNNFSNVPINQEGEIQRINQAEIGLKFRSDEFSVTTTLFWSQLQNIGISDFAFDADNGNVFYAPIQFNDSRTIGLEWNSSYKLFNSLRLGFDGILQNAIATQWTVFNTNGTIDTDDDSITDFSGRTLPFNPNLLFNLTTEYNQDKLNTFLKWQFIGEREGNIANAFQLASYSVFNAGISYSLNQNTTIDILASNLLNSDGLANFFGANSFGASANGFTEEFAQANPDASFTVVPILPRAITLQVGYTF